MICYIEVPLKAGLTVVITLDAGADPGFQARGGGALKTFAPIGGRRENCWGISCEKSRFYAKKSYFFPILGGARPPPPGSAPKMFIVCSIWKSTCRFNLFENAFKDFKVCLWSM